MQHRTTLLAVLAIAFVGVFVGPGLAISFIGFLSGHSAYFIFGFCLFLILLILCAILLLIFVRR